MRMGRLRRLVGGLTTALTGGLTAAGTTVTLAEEIAPHSPVLKWLLVGLGFVAGAVAGYWIGLSLVASKERHEDD